MADDATDTLFGFILFILFLALIGYAAGGISGSPSTAGIPSGTSQSYPPLTGGTASSCMGTADETSESLPTPTMTGEPANVTLNVHVDGSQTCAIAGFNHSPGSTRDDPVKLTVTLAYTGLCGAEPGVRSACLGENTTIAKSQSITFKLNESKMVGVQVGGYDNLCLSAFAELQQPGQPVLVNIQDVNRPCDPTPAAPPAGPMRDAPAVDVKEDQEDGY
jgi:hypothetical protein